MKYGGRERCRASVLLLVKPPGSGVHPLPPVCVLGVGSGPWCQQGARSAGCPLSLASAPSEKKAAIGSLRLANGNNELWHRTSGCAEALASSSAAGGAGRWLWGQGDKGKGPSGWLAQDTQLGGRRLSQGWKLSKLDLGTSRLRARANRLSPNETQAHE